MLADILARSRISRLTKALVYDRQSAASVVSFQSSNESAGDFGIMVTPRPEHSLTELEADVDSLLSVVRRDGSDRRRDQSLQGTLQLGFLGSLESNLGKAQRLAIGQAFHNDPNRAFAVDYAKYQAVTAADVKRVANTYLAKGRVVLSIVPVGKKDQASKAAASITVTQNAPTTKPNSSEAK